MLEKDRAEPASEPRVLYLWPEESLELPNSRARVEVPSGNLGDNGPPFGGVHLGPTFREQEQPAREALRNFHDTPLPVRSELEHAVGSALRPKRRIRFWNRCIVNQFSVFVPTHSV